ncbi:sulfurtransferase-like selenium metabolism protein YedF [Acetobacterium fimetarium]|uniref:Sulfurtransferase-like selenium metabolism protein YedF n=1 Tax=Acetobacterium fimetarium TaxID=52691 RepID=A0ABR6WWQ3_9FIRM|nr:sulfurtransferase-like selenium metabolism protein YedF [Acetobacterium fimetarium]MBC3804659.1 sulfurtransferase-like selenium metabolism protein YedF [Acetobacterium fimetarium]
MKIDARGQNCPIPVIMANKEIEKDTLTFTVLVDNAIAVENLNRLAQSKGYKVETKEIGADFSVSFIGDENSVHGSSTGDSEIVGTAAAAVHTGNWVLFMGKDVIGAGDPVLGGNLIKMYFYTLSQGDCLPEAILFMNDGVKLPSVNDQVVAHLKVLAERGCDILVCGTCLDFYKLTEQLQIGTISNMYDITEKINGAAKVVTL